MTYKLIMPVAVASKLKHFFFNEKGKESLTHLN